MASGAAGRCNEAAVWAGCSASRDVRGRLSCVLPGVGSDGLAKVSWSPALGATSAMVAGRFKAATRGADDVTEDVATGGRAAVGGSTAIDEDATTGEAAAADWDDVMGRGAATGAGAATGTGAATGGTPTAEAGVATGGGAGTRGVAAGWERALTTRVAEPCAAPLPGEEALPLGIAAATATAGPPDTPATGRGGLLPGAVGKNCAASDRPAAPPGTLVLTDAVEADANGIAPVAAAVEVAAAIDAVVDAAAAAAVAAAADAAAAAAALALRCSIRAAISRRSASRSLVRGGGSAPTTGGGSGVDPASASVEDRTRLL